MKILLLGAEGMLGREILKQLLDEKKRLNIYATIRGSSYKDKLDINKFDVVNNFDANDLQLTLKTLDHIKPDVIVNCIGVVKQLKADDDLFFRINSIFPLFLQHWVNRQKNSFLINISTDCVFNGKGAPYSITSMPDEIDIYGISKAFGEVKDKKSLTLRTSIIGHELKENKIALLDWFLNQHKKVYGYTNAYFSGLTTSVLAEYVILVIKNQKLTGLVNIPGPRISKFELLNIVKDVYSHNIDIVESSDLVIDKTLIGDDFYNVYNIKKKDWRAMLLHLKLNSINYV